MTEPDVTLTDYALAVECAVFCVLAARWSLAAGDAILRRWWIVFFASIGVASLIGGTVHGFFLAPGAANTALWRATLLCLGVTSLASWIIGARARLSPKAQALIQTLAIAALVAYAIIVVFVDDRFLVAIAMYVPATMFLLVIMVTLYARARSRPLALAVTGLVLTFVAAGIQQLRIAIHPVYFNHNALYHVVQGFALWLIYIGAKWVTANNSTIPATR
jgi:hypothetical protein